MKAFDGVAIDQSSIVWIRRAVLRRKKVSEDGSEGGKEGKDDE